VYDEIVVDPCHDAVAEFLDRLWVGRVREVLDVCCGTGLLAAELIARGYRVVGVDASEDMLARARRLLGPDVALIRSTLPDLPVEGTFDAAVCTLDGVTYLAPDELGPTLATLAARLRPSGWLVFDAHTDAMMAFTASRPAVSGEQNGHRFSISSAVDIGARRSDTRIEVVPSGGGASFREEHRQHFHPAAELRAALAAAGFEVAAVRDGYSDRPADTSTLTATWIARRLET
jgi:SAM-dependent methyltransferase